MHDQLFPLITVCQDLESKEDMS